MFIGGDFVCVCLFMFSVRVRVFVLRDCEFVFIVCVCASTYVRVCANHMHVCVFCAYFHALDKVQT